MNGIERSRGTPGAPAAAVDTVSLPVVRERGAEAERSRLHLGRLGQRAGYFVWHLVQMCMAMCIGIAVLDLPFFGAARLLGYSDPVRQLPELTALVVAFNMSAPMVAWMRYGMRHDWRCIGEMAGAMFVEAALVIAAAWLGLLSRSDVVPVQHALMVPAMLVPMLYRLDLYTGRMNHTAHAGTRTDGAHAS